MHETVNTAASEEQGGWIRCWLLEDLFESASYDTLNWNHKILHKYFLLSLSHIPLDVIWYVFLTQSTVQLLCEYIWACFGNGLTISSDTVFVVIQVTVIFGKVKGFTLHVIEQAGCLATKLLQNNIKSIDKKRRGISSACWHVIESVL